MKATERLAQVGNRTALLIADFPRYVREHAARSPWKTLGSYPTTCDLGLSSINGSAAHHQVYARHHEGGGSVGRLLRRELHCCEFLHELLLIPHLLSEGIQTILRPPSCCR